MGYLYLFCRLAQVVPENRRLNGCSSSSTSRRNNEPRKELRLASDDISAVLALVLVLPVLAAVLAVPLAVLVTS